MAWADAGFTFSITGVTVSPEQLAQAQGVIDLTSGTTQDAAVDLALRPRDLRFLRMAVAYQAAWMASQVDLFSRTEVSSLNQDGVQMTPGHSDALLLAPLARRALGRLSWRRTRSVPVRGPDPDGDSDALAALRHETRIVDRDDETWEPM